MFGWDEPIGLATHVSKFVAAELLANFGSTTGCCDGFPMLLKVSGNSQKKLGTGVVPWLLATDIHNNCAMKDGMLLAVVVMRRSHPAAAEDPAGGFSENAHWPSRMHQWHDKYAPPLKMTAAAKSQAFSVERAGRVAGMITKLKSMYTAPWYQAEYGCALEHDLAEMWAKLIESGEFDFPKASSLEEHKAAAGTKSGEPDWSALEAANGAVKAALNKRRSAGTSGNTLPGSSSGTKQLASAVQTLGSDISGAIAAMAGGGAAAAGASGAAKAKGALCKQLLPKVEYDADAVHAFQLASADNLVTMQLWESCEGNIDSFLAKHKILCPPSVTTTMPNCAK